MYNDDVIKTYIIVIICCLFENILSKIFLMKTLDTFILTGGKLKRDVVTVSVSHLSFFTPIKLKLIMTSLTTIMKQEHS